MSITSWSWKVWSLVAGAGAAALVVGGPFVYKMWISGDAPAPLTLPSSTPTAGSTPAAAAGSLDGTWTIAGGTVVGYRVQEVLFGQHNEAVGRTSKVTGTFTIAGTTVPSATFSADMASITSDQTRRDNQFRGRIMSVQEYPTATFKLTKPVVIGTIPADGVEENATATGELTLHGTTKTVTVKLTGRRNGDTIQIGGKIPIVFSQWNTEPELRPGVYRGQRRARVRPRLHASLDGAPTVSGWRAGPTPG